MIGSLTLDQLRVLVAIADTGSFSAAGRRLRRVQSAVSQAVANLEAMQGIALFDRQGHRPQLTEVGRVLVDQARLVLASASRFEAVAASTRAGVEPQLAIAIDPLVPTAPLIDSLRALSQAFPDLPVHFSTEGLGGSLRRLRSDSAAMALCLLLPGVPEDIAAYPLLRTPCARWPRRAIRWPRWAARPRRATWRRTSNWCCRTRPIRTAPTTAWRAPGCGVLPIWAAAWTSCWRDSAGAACPSTWWQRPSRQGHSSPSRSTTTPLHPKG